MPKPLTRIDLFYLHHHRRIWFANLITSSAASCGLLIYGHFSTLTILGLICEAQDFGINLFKYDRVQIEMFPSFVHLWTLFRGHVQHLLRQFHGAKRGIDSTISLLVGNRANGVQSL
jgi:hypothetical protein